MQFGLSCFRVGSHDGVGDELVRVYRPAVPDGSEWVFPLDENDWETFRSFDGSSRLASWRPVKVRLGYSEEGVEYRPAVMPWMGGHVLVLKQEAVGAVGQALSRWGELLPLECDEAELFVFNALRFVSALDEDRSDLLRFGEGRIMKINKHVFDPRAIADVEMFKLTEMPRGSLYLTDPVVELIESSGLGGTGFELVWSGDTS